MSTVLVMTRLDSWQTPLPTTAPNDDAIAFADAAARARILTDHATSMIVEAAAGTG